MFVKWYSIVFAMLLLVSFVAGQTIEPFGFRQGLTKQQVIAMVGAGNVTANDGDELTLSTAPKPNFNFSHYTLVISPTEGLLRILASTPDIKSGDTGDDLRLIFNRIVAGVTQKYGKPTLIQDYCNGGLGCSGDEFWMLSLFEKNRVLNARWDSPDIFVPVLSLKLGTGFVGFVFDFPGYKSYDAAKKAKQNNF